MLFFVTRCVSILQIAVNAKVNMKLRRCEKQLQRTKLDKKKINLILEVLVRTYFESKDGKKSESVLTKLRKNFLILMHMMSRLIKKFLTFLFNTLVFQISKRFRWSNLESGYDILLIKRKEDLACMLKALKKYWIKQMRVTTE